MASTSKNFTGRRDEQAAELKELAKLTTVTAERLTLNKLALAALETVTGKSDDTVNIAVNASDDGIGGRAFTLSISVAPAPPPPKPPAKAPPG